MSKEYPCIYYKNEKCEKFSVDGVISYCVMGPCPHETPSNADRIRYMSDEELSKFLCDFRSCDADEHPCKNCKGEPYCRSGHTGMIDWLRKPAGEGRLKEE